MSSTMMTERSHAGAAFSSAAAWQNAGSATMPGAANFGVLPRCKYEFEKCAGGFKIHCSCEDEVACGTLQNLCRMLADGTCSCCCTSNGIAICQCNLTIGMCHTEMTKDGVCITCTSGDKKCACDVASLLRLPGRLLLRTGLLLLHCVQQHAVLLRQVLSY